MWFTARVFEEVIVRRKYTRVKACTSRYQWNKICKKSSKCCWSKCWEIVFNFIVLSTGCPRSCAPPMFFTTIYHLISYMCAVKKFIDQLSQTGIIIKQNILKVYKLDFFKIKLLWLYIMRDFWDTLYVLLCTVYIALYVHCSVQLHEIKLNFVFLILDKSLFYCSGACFNRYVLAIHFPCCKYCKIAWTKIVVVFALISWVLCFICFNLIGFFQLP